MRHAALALAALISLAACSEQAAEAPKADAAPPAGVATAATKAANTALAERLPLDQPGDFEDADQGLLAQIQEDIVDEPNNTAFDIFHGRQEDRPRRVTHGKRGQKILQFQLVIQFWPLEALSSENSKTSTPTSIIFMNNNNHINIVIDDSYPSYDHDCYSYYAYRSHSCLPCSSYYR